MDEIHVRRYSDSQTEITISDYHGPGAPLVIDLSDDQAAQLRAQLSPKLMRYPVAVSPAKARMTSQ
ncbi:Uncharacterised protein [Mycobacteroides abscessus subsp. abscessus]|nr:Uncharacterised protein [Mycobacteroides abscessus subsp. abscessus]SLK74665.1 Uncharacterised protein [Mycobacteroides abscessus subsp. abscessus]